MGGVLLEQSLLEFRIIIGSDVCSTKATESQSATGRELSGSHGVRIVDRMTMLSGSWATMFLADQKIPADPVFFDRF